jgi:hypothetical protein
VFVVPAAVVAVWDLWARLRAAGRPRLALALVALCVVQLELGASTSIEHIVALGLGGGGHIPANVMTAVSSIPAGSKIAYGCLPLDEGTYGTPNLLTIAAYTGHPVVPMCFEADLFGLYVGEPLSLDRPNADVWAPQRSLYPSSSAEPSPTQVAAFLKAHGVDYIYTDPRHTNPLVADAVPIVETGGYQLLRVP